MTKYITNKHLIINGGVAKPGSEVEIKEKAQADRLLENGTIEKPATKKADSDSGK